MEKFKSPKLLITDHCDEQIRHVDIYIEKLLKKYHENDLLPKEEFNRSNISDDDSDDEYGYINWNDETINKIEGFKDPYRWKYKYDQNKLLHLDIIPGTTRVRDYLELVRMKTIDELKKSEQHNLDNYELNKDHYKYNRKSLTDEKVEEMRQNLFKNKFAFVVKIGKWDKSLLKFHTILTDFYLDEKDIKFLEREPWDLYDNYKDILDEKSLVLNLLKRYIFGLTENYEYGTEIISIPKWSLFEINKPYIYLMELNHVNLPSNSLIDFSFIKSLKLDSVGSKCETSNELRDLSGLKQLEYLQIKHMQLTENSFDGLNNLIKLELIECYYTSEKIICFDSLNNLQFLRIYDFDFDIELKSLENLKVLIIEFMNDLENIIDISESITHLRLNALNISTSTADEFFSLVCLPNLIHLNMNYLGLTCLKEQWVSGILFLKELILHQNHLEKLNFCRFDCLVYLEKLDLSTNFIEKLDEGAFSKLKLLKWLNLSTNPLLELGSNAFRGLKNLEILILNEINERKKFNRIEKDAFNGLKNLKKLSLEGNYLEYIDPEAFGLTPKLNELSLKHNRLKSIDPKVFSYIPKIVELKICGNKMKLEENMSSNLIHLKRIVFGENDVEFINKDLFEMLKKSEVKLVIEEI